MEFVNKTGLAAGWTIGFERDGRELLVVVVKATYVMPFNGAEPQLAAEQIELTKADEFTGEPGRSALLYETDYAHRKVQCDIVLNGAAYAPGAIPQTSVKVSLRVGSVRKAFWVFGDRKWLDVMGSVSRPDPFTSMPISYDRAYGGADSDENDPKNVVTYAENPVGTGYHPVRRRAGLVGRLLANTAEGGSPITDTKGRYKPMSFGPVGRNFLARRKLAGTYDQNWLANEAPFWPADFSYAYFQSAPDDQQGPMLKGNEEVELVNLTKDSWRFFRLPRRSVPVTFLPHNGADVQVEAACDTLVLEPDLSRFSMTWRMPFPLRRHMFEMKQVIVGEISMSWRSARRAQEKGKAYFASLAEGVASRGGRRSRP